MAVIDLDGGHVKTGSYKFVENVLTETLDYRRIRDIVTESSMETVCSAANVDKISKRLATVFSIRSR